MRLTARLIPIKLRRPSARNCPTSRGSLASFTSIEVVAILRRRSPLILAIAGIGTVLAIVVGLLIPPKYTAMAQLVIEAPAGSAATSARQGCRRWTRALTLT